jgi:hypothetical protein
MKSTILITAIAILAFNFNPGHKKARHLELANIETYMRSVALTNQPLRSSSFISADIKFVPDAIKGNKKRNYCDPKGFAKISQYSN